MKKQNRTFALATGVMMLSILLAMAASGQTPVDPSLPYMVFKNGNEKIIVSTSNGQGELTPESTKVFLVSGIKPTVFDVTEVPSQIVRASSKFVLTNGVEIHLAPDKSTAKLHTLDGAMLLYERGEIDSYSPQFYRHLGLIATSAATISRPSLLLDDSSRCRSLFD